VLLCSRLHGPGLCRPSHHQQDSATSREQEAGDAGPERERPGPNGGAGSTAGAAVEKYGQHETSRPRGRIHHSSSDRRTPICIPICTCTCAIIVVVVVLATYREQQERGGCGRFRWKGARFWELSSSNLAAAAGSPAAAAAAAAAAGSTRPLKKQEQQRQRQQQQSSSQPPQASS